MGKQEKATGPQGYATNTDVFGLRDAEQSNVPVKPRRQPKHPPCMRAARLALGIILEAQMLHAAAVAPHEFERLDADL
ncbi:MAG: hypothetical protein K8F35_11215, partial [Dokdonella sp.]|nr:hypothetical protein [Dokdonella sp.]